MNTPCCEPGCTAEVLCPVHQALADLRAKVDGLVDIAAREYEQSDYFDTEAHARKVAYEEVLALLEEKP